MRIYFSIILIFSFVSGNLSALEMNIPDGDSTKAIMVRRFVVHDEHIALAPHTYRGGLTESRMANLFFDKEAFAINPDLPANRMPFVSHQLELLFNPMENGWLPDTVVITAFTSPDGNSVYNETLAKKRAAAGAAYVRDMIGRTCKEKTACTILTETAGEDWEGLAKTLRASDLAGRDTILYIIDNQYNTGEEIMEQLQRSPLYPTIKQNFYPLLRRISIRIAYHEPLKTDGEMLKRALGDPATLRFGELMYAATLTDDPEKKMEICRNAATRFPEEWEAPNNLACLYFDMGETEKAMVYLNNALTLFPVNGIILNNLAVGSLRMNRLDKAKQYLDLAKKEEADIGYNLGIYYLLGGDYENAFSLLEPYPCNINAALAALMADQAAKALERVRCSPESGDRHYLSAICLAKSDEESSVAGELEQAVRLDSTLLDYLRNDIEFSPYKEKDWYRRITSR